MPAAPLELWLVRHAKAPSAEEFKGPDSDRPLDPDGVAKFTKFCEWVAEQTTIPYVIVSSGFKRALQTAQILATAAGIPATQILSAPELDPGQDMTALWRFLRDQTAPRIALVFHEPELSQFLNSSVGGGHFEWAKGGIACVDFEEEATPGDGKLRWFIRRRLD
jgi:phosphohistidine phosphatase